MRFTLTSVGGVLAMQNHIKVYNKYLGDWGLTWGLIKTKKYKKGCFIGVNAVKQGNVL